MTRLRTTAIGRYIGASRLRLMLIAVPAAVIAAAVGCAERITGPEQRLTSDLHFLRARAGAPELATLSATFYAKRGEDRGVKLYYHALPGAKDSARFLDFRVPAGALDRRPDGTQYLPGDSVLIRVTVADPGRMIVAFEPSGLKFSAASPARMEISFRETDDDLNGDGVIDATDTALKGQLSIWVQESLGGLWTRLPSALFLDLEELETPVPGFSGYASAY